MQVKNRIHVVLLKSCESLKEGLIKVYLLNGFSCGCAACLSTHYSSAAHLTPAPPAAQSISSFTRSPQCLSGKCQPLLKIELRAQERYMITSQCRA